MPDYVSEVGRRLRAHREQAGLSREGLAALTGVSVRTIARTELGGGLPRIQNLEALARGVGTTVADLLSQSERVA